VINFLRFWGCLDIGAKGKASLAHMIERFCSIVEAQTPMPNVSPGSTGLFYMHKFICI
jgi:hypothetical protein